MNVSRRTALFASIAGVAAIVTIAAVLIRPLGLPGAHPPTSAGPSSTASGNGGGAGVVGGSGSGSGTAGSGGSSGAAGSSPSLVPTPVPPSPSPLPGAFRAPSIHWPLPDLDPGLATRGPRPSLAELSGFLYGNKPLLSVDPLAGPLDWRLSDPNPSAVTGYAGDVSVLPGGSLALHLAGSDASARVDIFRLGVVHDYRSDHAKEKLVIAAHQQLV